jgi:hypothetical protein
MREYYREYNRLYRAKNGYYNEALWKKNNRFKVNAQAILQKAVKMGKVEKKPCKFCGDSNSIAHHPDYTKPLKVVWICKIHHRKIHYGEKSYPSLTLAA